MPWEIGHIIVSTGDYYCNGLCHFLVRRLKTAQEFCHIVIRSTCRFDTLEVCHFLVRRRSIRDRQESDIPIQVGLKLDKFRQTTSDCHVLRLSWTTTTSSLRFRVIVLRHLSLEWSDSNSLSSQVLSDKDLRKSNLSLSFALRFSI